MPTEPSRDGAVDQASWLLCLLDVMYEGPDAVSADAEDMILERLAYLSTLDDRTRRLVHRMAPGALEQPLFVD